MTAKMPQKIEPQKDGESLEDRVNGEEEFVLEESKPEATEIDVGIEYISNEELGVTEKIEEDTEVEVMVDPSYTPEEDQTGPYVEPESVPVGKADHQDEFYISPPKLEEIHQFLNKYGIMTEGLSPKEVIGKFKKVKEAKEEASQVLSRGRAIDGISRLLSFVPEGFIGEFKRENDIDISRAKTLGFTVLVSDDARLDSSTGKSDGLVRFGDQILMIIPEERHVGNRLAKAERLAKRRAARRVTEGSNIPQGEADPLFPLIKL